MSSVYDRRATEPLRKELRRLIIVGVSLALASAGWHALRPHLIEFFARTGVGAPGREPLIAYMLHRRGILGPAGDEAFEEARRTGWSRVTAYSLPKPGWIEWERVQPDNYQNWEDYRGERGFTDDLFRPHGKLAYVSSTETPPGDFDGDGRWEIVSWFNPDAKPDPSGPFLNGWAVIRLGESNNAVAWIGIRPWDRLVGKIRPLWRDEDGDGRKELVFVTRIYIKLPNGDVGLKPPETVAVFAWDRPGGVLRPRLLPPDGSFVSWTPPDGTPVQVAQDAAMDPILRKFLPVPPGFGRPSTAPSTTPAQAANSQPSGYDSPP